LQVVPEFTTPNKLHATMKDNYVYLEKSIKILAVDDEPYILDIYGAYLKDFPLFTIDTADTVAEAQELMQKDGGYDVCIFDLGMAEGKKDEFFFLKKYAQRLPFVVVTGTTSTSKGFNSRLYGAYNIISKIDATRTVLIKEICDAFLWSLIKPYGTKQHPFFEKAAQICLENFPENVHVWAERLDVSGSYLRRLYMEFYELRPKYVLFLYDLYKHALGFHYHKLIKKLPEFTDLTTDKYRKYKDYYLENKEPLTRVIRRKLDETEDETTEKVSS